MITAEKKREIQEQLRFLAETNATAVAQIEKTIALLAIALELDDPFSPADSSPGPLQAADHCPLLDHTTFSVKWQDRTCFLGNTLLFHFLARIARCPNRYVTHVDLLEEVWGGEREATTIRGVAKRLRDRLTASEMEKLANLIDGSVPGHYGLILV